jgi:nucleoside-diphosphate-sugar epimerase
MRGETVLVTGANGFLGQAILAELQSAECSVCGTDLGAGNHVPALEYYKADITKVGNLRPVLEKKNIVIHVAGLAHVFFPYTNSVDRFRRVNEFGTVNAVNAAVAAGVKHFILISSVSVYGPYTHGVYDENTPYNPVGPYAVSKRNAELRAIEIAQKSGMALTILRLATLYGEGDPGNVGRLVRSIDRGRFLWIGDGINRKSMLYKGDAARACVAVAERPASGINIYNVSAPFCTMREVVDGISNALGKHLLPVRFPAFLALLLSRYISKIPNRRMAGIHQTVKKWLAEDVYDTRRFERAYNYQTKTTLQEGLKREVAWYLHNKHNHS